MKMLNKTLLALLATSAVSVGANAAIFNNTGYTGTTGYTGHPYVGIKAGQVMIDDADNAGAFGGYVGYQFDPNWGVEADYVGTSDTDTDVSGIEYNAKAYGAYATYKYGLTNTPMYIKGKLGAAKSEVEVKAKEGSGSFTADKTGVAGGLGLGYNVSPNVALEANYDILPKAEYDDADTKVNMWTIGAHYKF